MLGKPFIWFKKRVIQNRFHSDSVKCEMYYLYSEYKDKKSRPPDTWPIPALLGIAPAVRCMHACRTELPSARDAWCRGSLPEIMTNTAAVHISIMPLFFRLRTSANAEANAPSLRPGASRTVTPPLLFSLHLAFSSFISHQNHTYPHKHTVLESPKKIRFNCWW